MNRLHTFAVVEHRIKHRMVPFWNGLTFVPSPRESHSIRVLSSHKTSVEAEYHAERHQRHGLRIVVERSSHLPLLHNPSRLGWTPVKYHARSARNVPTRLWRK